MVHHYSFVSGSNPWWQISAALILKSYSGIIPKHVKQCFSWLKWERKQVFSPKPVSVYCTISPQARSQILLWMTGKEGSEAEPAAYSLLEFCQWGNGRQEWGKHYAFHNPQSEQEPVQSCIMALQRRATDCI